MKGGEFLDLLTLLASQDEFCSMELVFYIYYVLIFYTLNYRYGFLCLMMHFICVSFFSSHNHGHGPEMKHGFLM